MLVTGCPGETKENAGFTPVKQKKIRVLPRWNKHKKLIPLGRQGKQGKRGRQPIRKRTMP